MTAKKTRRSYVLFPLILIGAVSISSACSDGGSTGGGGDPSVGGEASGGDGSGATSNIGGSEAAGAPSSAGNGSGGAEAGAAGAAVGGGGADLCAGLELECEDDDNPCTEDECNPATGECGIPRNGTSCDDELFCNGADECVEGECSKHEGNPCGENVCDEAEDYCECASDDDCPADEPGDWAECVYGNICVETGTRSRPVTTYTCDVGKCVSDAEVEMEECPRETDGVQCTDDNKRCNGAEACKAGNCASGANPCAGMAATPYCYESGTMCRECSGNMGCGSGEKCCLGNCIPEANTCFIVVPATSISPTTATISPSFTQ